MFRLLISLVTMGAVISCSMENTETSGVLVDPNSEQEMPDGITVSDVDFNRDGTIDTLDLELLAHFFGQDVPEAEPTNVSDGSDPCRAVNNLKLDALAYDPENKVVYTDTIDSVEDNKEYKEIFDAPNGNNYVYALIAPMSNPTDESKDEAYYKVPKEERRKYYLPPCLAMRITVDNNQMIKELKIKAVGGNNKFSKTIISPFKRFRSGLSADPDYVSKNTCPDNIELHVALNTTNCSYYKDGTHIFAGTMRRTFYSDGFGQLATEKAIDSYQSMSNDKDKWFWGPRNQIVQKEGIPIGNDYILNSIKFAGKFTSGDTNQIEFGYSWGVGFQKIRDGMFFTNYEEVGAYLKMLPAEVQSIYFHEDTQ